MKFVQDGKWDVAVAFCQAIMSGEASKQVLDAAKKEFLMIPYQLRKGVIRSAIGKRNQEATEEQKNAIHHTRTPIRCALANL